MTIGRKNYLFLGSHNGGKTAALLHNITASVKTNQVEPFSYFCNLLARLSDSSTPADATLLPDTL